jgi:hypothetical protein
MFKEQSSTHINLVFAPPPHNPTADATLILPSIDKIMPTLNVKE